jgi:hypothetical protein
MTTQDNKENKVLSTDQVIDRLRQVKNAYDGGPLPEWLETNVWGEVLSKLAGDAADLIEWYRSGKVPSSAIDMVTYTCHWCGARNTQPHGQCRCEKCGNARGSKPIDDVLT